MQAGNDKGTQAHGPAGEPVHSTASPSRNPIGTISLLVAAGGALATRLAQRYGGLGEPPWLDILGAGFDAALVGALADWFAVTALFRHPLGLPIPHTAIIPRRRAKIIEGIVSMVQDEWLSPAVLSTRLQRVAPSALVLDWLESPEHVTRLGAPLRDALRAVARLINDPAVVGFAEHTLLRELRAVPLDRSAGAWILRVCSGEAIGVAFSSAAQSLANLAQQPQTTEALQAWLDRAATQLHADGKRLVPLLLRRKMIQRKVVEAACDYAASELAAAARDHEHRLRQAVFGAVRRFGERLSAGDPDALAQVEQLRRALADSLETRPLIGDLLGRLQKQLDAELASNGSELAGLIDFQLRHGIRDLLADPEHAGRFDDWVRATATDLLRRHHDQIGLTVRENLEALETSALVSQIEARVGSDLQFIRLNGALVGGLIGLLLALLHRVL